MFLDDFADKSHLNLLQTNSKLALAYLVSRGITLEEIKKYKIGFSPISYKNIKSDEKEAENFNKWIGFNGKFIKKRLVFPIYDEMGKIRGVETRSLDKRSMGVLKPNFKKSMANLINSLPESEIRYKKFYFEKNKFLPNFYGLPDALDSIWETKTVFLTEGIFDLLSIRKVKPNCLSPLTANVSQYQINWLKRYVDKIILLFDMDEKGKEAAEKMKNNLGNNFVIHSIPFKGKDLNDYLVKNGEIDLKYYIESKLDTIF